MNSPRTLRCAMKMRTCGLFWHKAVISLTLPPRHAPNTSSEGCLTIARPKIFGGMIKVSLDNNPHEITLAPVSGKDARHYQFTIRYGQHRRVTLRAPTKAIYETWWTALESALTLPTFIVVSAPTPVRPETIVLAPVHPNAARTRRVGVLQPLTEVGHEDKLADDVPILEAGGPTSPTELDILASWRTWGSLDYFASQPSLLSARMTDSNLEPTASNNASDNDDNSSVGSRDKMSVDSNISEFWSRPSEWQDEMLQHDSTNIAENDPPALLRTLQPQHEEIWLEEVADFVFQQKTLIPPKYPTMPIPRQLHPFLQYAMI